MFVGSGLLPTPHFTVDLLFLNSCPMDFRLQEQIKIQSHKDCLFSPRNEGGGHHCVSLSPVIPPTRSTPQVEPWQIRSWTKETYWRWCCCRGRSDSTYREEGTDLRYIRKVGSQDLVTQQIWQWGGERGQEWAQGFQVRWLGGGIFGWGQGVGRSGNLCVRLDKSLSVISVGHMDPQLVGAEPDHNQYTMEQVSSLWEGR